MVQQAVRLGDKEIPLEICLRLGSERASPLLCQALERLLDAAVEGGQAA